MNDTISVWVSLNVSQFYFLLDAPGMSFVQGIVCPQASQTCCDTIRNMQASIRKLLKSMFPERNRMNQRGHHKKFMFSHFLKRKLARAGWEVISKLLTVCVLQKFSGVYKEYQNFRGLFIFQFPKISWGDPNVFEKIIPSKNFRCY